VNSRQRRKKRRRSDFSLAGNKLKILRFQLYIAKATQIPLKMLYSSETISKLKGSLK
jgi:hypothetical protein